MKNLLWIALFFCMPAFGQLDELAKASKELHIMLVKNDPKLASALDKNLSYGHSNGWVETKEDLLQNLATGKMKYVEIIEDSVSVLGDKKMANVRYKSVITAVLNGNQVIVNLRVLEVWRNKDGQWLLFSRQAVRQN